MATLDQQLEDSLQRRKRIMAEVERLKGRREQAQTALTSVEEEIKAKGIEPSKIDEKLKQLEDKYRSLIEDLTRNVADAERAIEPFVKGNGNT
jgi:uncharacterized protein YfcZ (UPF0381/DUF406 family)